MRRRCFFFIAAKAKKKTTMSTQPPTPAAAAAADNNEQEKRQKDDDDDDDNNGARANHDHHPHDHHLGTLERRLKSRHVQFLALSGAIGTGLFVGTGQVLSLGGPLAAVLAYAITGANLYCVMVCLGEMAAWLPVPGAMYVFFLSLLHLPSKFDSLF